MGLTKPKNAGVSLPVLSNPATAENIDNGFEAIDGLGALLTGTGNKKEVYTTVKSFSSGVSNFTDTNLIGKSNVVVLTTIANGTSSYSISFFCVVGDKKITEYYYGGNKIDTSGNFDSSTGKVSANSNFAFRSGQDYLIIAW